MTLKNILLGIIVLLFCSGSYSQEVNKEKVLKDILPGVLEKLRLVVVYKTDKFSTEIPDSIRYDTALLINNREKYHDKITKWKDKNQPKYYPPDSIDCEKKNYTYVITVFDTLYEMPDKKLNSLYERISKIDSLNEYSTILAKYFNNKDKKVPIEFDSVQIGDCYLTVNKRLTEDNFYKYGNFYLGSIAFSKIYVNDKEDRAVIIFAYFYARHLFEYYICLKKKDIDWKIENIKEIF